MGIIARIACATLSIALLSSGTAAAPAAPAADPREAAIILYDQGKYREAQEALKALEAAGTADGSIIYRLAFCEGALGATAERAQLLERATAELEKETAAGGTIESWFYLSNVYRNLGRIAESAKVAADATSRIEAGTLKPPVRGVDVFRVAKLYADQGREDRAPAEYRKAIEALKPEADRYPSYLRWSRGYLGDLAMRGMEWESAANEYKEVVAVPGATTVDWTKLAIAQVRLGRFNDAAEAWRRAEQTDPAGGDDARYSRQLALQAAALGSIPSLAPGGKTWDQPAAEDLESLMVEQAKVAAEARPAPAAESEPGSSPAAAPAAVPAPDLPARLREAHRIFVAAGIEYAARGLPIRETAFGKGFAQLVFHPEKWEMPEAEKK